MSTRLNVVGGVYVERCVQPLWNAVFGSGGRAAAAASKLVDKVVLDTYLSGTLRADVEGLASRFEFDLKPHDAMSHVVFDYFHPLSRPQIWPTPPRISQNPIIQVRGDVVLRFGMMEGDAMVEADRVIYDPQSAFDVAPFSQNGSQANHLAIVLNRAEANALTGKDEDRAMLDDLLSTHNAECVVLKRGGAGATIATQSQTETVPVFATDAVFKIGSGDVFSGVFAALWGCARLDPVECAVLASRATALYVDRRQLPSPSPQDLNALQYRPVAPRQGTVYIAAPFFDIGQRWVVDELRSQLRAAGAQVFSPVHDVGRGPAEMVAHRDLEGLERADAVMAIVSGEDPGTLFEVGYARKLGKPVVALAQEVRPEDLKMIIGSGCEVVDDFASAIYRVMWALS